jgi:transposase
MPVMNDKKAAEALALLLAAGLLRSVWVPTPQVRDQRSLIAQRWDRVRATTQAKNRLHSVLFRHQFKKPKAPQPFSAKHRDFWLTLPVSPIEQLAIELDLDTIDQAEKQRRRLETLIKQTALADDRLPFLLQLPGVGLVTALTILAALGPIERFASSKALVGYAGLGARVHDSGQKRTSGRITKAGRKDLRHALINAAQRAALTHPHWQAELARLQPRLGRNKAIVAIARKLLVSVWHVLTKRQADRYANAQQVANSFLATVYKDIGARNLPNGETALEFVRRNLDSLGLGKDLLYVTRAGHVYFLPQSALPGAPPAAQPTGRGRSQNTKAAQAERHAHAAAKREALAQKQAQATPRKPRADKGRKRQPRAAVARPVA